MLLASKSTKLDMAKMGLVDPLPMQVYMVLYLKQLVLSDNNLIAVSPFIGNPRMHGLMQVWRPECLALLWRDSTVLGRIQSVQRSLRILALSNVPELSSSVAS